MGLRGKNSSIVGPKGAILNSEYIYGRKNEPISVADYCPKGRFATCFLPALLLSPQRISVRTGCQILFATRLCALSPVSSSGVPQSSVLGRPNQVFFHIRYLLFRELRSLPPFPEPNNDCYGRRAMFFYGP